MSLLHLKNEEKEIRDRQVIFIGGVQYSGTTLLDLILANDSVGFSCGEVHKLFISPGNWLSRGRCVCGNNNCDVWKRVYRGKESHLYETVFRISPETTFIVDSSKIPFWILHKARALNHARIKTRNVLIWKTPLESANSFSKRNLFEKWEKMWISYHRLYFSLIEDFRSIRYYDVVNNRESLIDLCSYLEINDFPGKENFWERKFHTLGGNASTIIHLYHKDKASFKSVQNFVSSRTRRNDLYIKKRHRSLYYEKADEAVSIEVKKRLMENPILLQIQEILNSKNVISTAPLSKALESNLRTLMYSKTFILMHQMRFRITQFVRKVLNAY